MKYLKPTLAALLLPLLMHAQIPNAGFENWTIINSNLYPDGWDNMNAYSSAGGAVLVSSGGPGNPGNYFMKVETKLLPVPNFVLEGISICGIMDHSNMQPQSGFAYNQRPAGITGCWQYATWGGSISAKLTRWDTTLNTRIPVAAANLSVWGSASNWTYFNALFSYTDNQFPDTCIIVFKSSGPNHIAGDYLWVDDLGFAGWVGVSDPTQSLLQQVSVFPNPAGSSANVKINLQQAQTAHLSICDLQGRIVRSEDADLQAGENTRTLDLTALARGTYLLRVVAAEGTAVCTLVTQ